MQLLINPCVTIGALIGSYPREYIFALRIKLGIGYQTIRRLRWCSKIHVLSEYGLSHH
jgi:hypothetical protein